MPCSQIADNPASEMRRQKITAWTHDTLIVVRKVSKRLYHKSFRNDFLFLAKSKKRLVCHRLLATGDTIEFIVISAADHRSAETGRYDNNRERKLAYLECQTKNALPKIVESVLYFCFTRL
jgi:hypothetical protein